MFSSRVSGATFVSPLTRLHYRPRGEGTEALEALVAFAREIFDQRAGNFGQRRVNLLERHRRIGVSTRF